MVRQVKLKMPAPRSTNRKDDILQALAAMLENHPGQRITTAALAAAVGVSEAALYRHFPSKARMFEGLIEFIEATLLGTISKILQEHKQTEPLQASQQTPPAMPAPMFRPGAGSPRQCC